VVEIGAPAELISAGGRYQQMHQLQFGQQVMETKGQSCVSR
jgi:hypothetical protein